ncbi:hypothetical protein F5Y04DRAFT_263910 [Hypomontagnella monticulosa]|nr:hypothetical protein F5Y04DRAFT_263910 [Hypomontagnella monticulosa]
MVCDVAAHPPIANGSPGDCDSTPVVPSVSDRDIFTRYHSSTKLGARTQGGQYLSGGDPS